MSLGRFQQHNAMTGLLLSVVISLRLLLIPLLAAAVETGLLQVTGLIRMPPWAWVMTTPLLYYIWLILMLAGSALETTLMSRHLVKSRRVVFSARTRRIIPIPLPIAMYGRMQTLITLPGTGIFRWVPGLRWLWFRAYSPSVHLAPLSVVTGHIYDPDITYVGDGAIIGVGCQIVGHAISRLPTGEVVFHTAPIHIGRYATIGGDSRVHMGVTIGDGALVEPCSHVTAFTAIPSGEVWGGSPAIFVRKREGTSGRSLAPAPSAPVAVVASRHSVTDVLAVLAQALGVRLEEVTVETNSSNCMTWDSVGKIAIAAALHDRFSISLGPQEMFQLDSVADVMNALEGRAKTKTPRLPSKEPLPRLPELWPLLDPAEATAALAEKNPGVSGVPASKMRICIAASFVAEPLAPALKLWCGAFGIEAEIVFAGFNQLQAELLLPGSLFAQNREGLNILLTRPEDLAGDHGGDLARRVEQLLIAINQFSEQSTHRLVVADLPPLVSLRFTGDVDEIEPARRLWRERLGAFEQVDRLDFAAIIEELGTTASRDDAMESEASAPYSPAVYQRLGRSIARFARRLRVPSKKVAALDADGVLWGGIVGEDGPQNLNVSGPFRHAQQLFRSWRERGVLLVLVSRNEPEDIWRVFDAHPDMPLHRDDFAGFAINWKPKSENLRTLAKGLNLDLDSFVFIDDSPSERAEVEAACPEVTVVPLPSEPAQAMARLNRLWCFDVAAITAEDAIRTQLMQSASERRTLAESGLHYDDYLRSLELHVQVRPAESADLARVAQLTQKTNQFNLSLRRRTLGEIEALAATHDIWIVSARDRFGDYGIVGAALIEPPKQPAGTATLDTFLLSCRALGRGVEEIFLHALGQVATKRGGLRLAAPYVAGPRNQPVRDFFQRQKWPAGDDSVFAITIAEMAPPPSHATCDLVLR